MSAAPSDAISAAKGQSDLSAKLSSWREGSAGFFKFLEDAKPRILNEKREWVPLVFSEQVKEEIRQALDSGASTMVFSWPRRHGKTVVVAAIIVWRFLTRKNEFGALVANSKLQAVDVAFKLVKAMLEHTPYSKRLISEGHIVVGVDRITYSALGSQIVGYPANPASLYGIKISTGQVSELHAAANAESFNVVAGSVLDTAGGLVLIDSTVGSRASPLFALWEAWERGEKAIHVSHIGYANIDDACAHLPPWINAAGLRALAATMLPQVFAQQHLNQWATGSNSLFPPEVLDKCRDGYPLDIPAITQGAAFAVGAGLDRAFGFSLHGDQTVSCAVLKINRDEEDHFFVLDSRVVKFSSASGIRAAFTEYKDKFSLSKAAIETYNSQDVFAWMQDQPFDAELIHATSERQANAFTALYNAASDGRLHIAPQFEKLFKEMGSFEYWLDTDGNRGVLPKFQGAGSSKDDHVYALAWAIYSLRTAEIPAYAVNGIVCNAVGPAVRLCVLNGGDLVPPCADMCQSLKEIGKLYKGHCSRTGAKLPFKEFFRGKVVNKGAHVKQR